MTTRTIIEVARRGRDGDYTGAADVAALDTRVDTAEVSVARLNTQRYDVRAYGAAGSGAAVIAAMAAASAAGGGIVTGPLDAYTFTSPVPHAHNVTVDMPLGTVFDMTGVTTGLGPGSLWYGAGSLTALPALGAAVALGATTVTFATAPTLAPGDWFILYNSVDGSFSPERLYYRDGEFCRVVSVAGNVVTLAEATYSAYATGGTVTAHRMEPLVARISGVTFLLPDGKWGINFDLATRVQLDNVTVYGGNWGAFMFQRCVDITLATPRAFSARPTDGAGINYGVVIGNCQDITITTPDLRVGRHGFTTGGGSDTGCVPNRNIKVFGGTVSSTLDTTYGCDTHANTEWVWFRDVTMPKGMHIAGDHLRIKGGMIASSGVGIAIEITHHLGWDIEIDTDIVATRQLSASGLIYVRAIADTTRAGGTLKIGGTINLGAFRAPSGNATEAIEISATGGAAGRIHLTPTVKATGTVPGDSVWGAYLYQGGGGAPKFAEVTIGGRWEGVNVDVRYADLATITGAVSRDAPGHGVSVTTTSHIRSRGNDVKRAGAAGLNYNAGDTTNGTITSIDDESLDNNQQNAAVSNNASIAIFNAKDVVYRGAIIGDTQATTKQLRADAIATVTTLREEPAAILGTVTTRNRSGITTTTAI